MAYLRSLFGAISNEPADVEARCLMAFSLFLANDYIAADHPGRRSRATVIKAATERLLM
jgi:hypothetical protein